MCKKYLGDKKTYKISKHHSVEMNRVFPLYKRITYVRVCAYENGSRKLENYILKIARARGIQSINVGEKFPINRFNLKSK